jgi:hypothetical protein
MYSNRAILSTTTALVLPCISIFLTYYAFLNQHLMIFRTKGIAHMRMLTISAVLTSLAALALIWAIEFEVDISILRVIDSLQMCMMIIGGIPIGTLQLMIYHCFQGLRDLDSWIPKWARRGQGINPDRLLIVITVPLGLLYIPFEIFYIITALDEIIPVWAPTAGWFVYFALIMYFWFYYLYLNRNLNPYFTNLYLNIVMVVECLICFAVEFILSFVVYGDGLGNWDNYDQSKIISTSINVVLMNALVATLLGYPVYAVFFKRQAVIDTWQSARIASRLASDSPRSSQSSHQEIPPVIRSIEAFRVINP